MKKSIVILLALAIGIVILNFSVRDSSQPATKNQQSLAPDLSSLSIATFAGGCFWCVESKFEKLAGVSEVVSGYSGGHTENPTYSDVSGGSTGHTEAVQIYYDPGIVSYEGLLHHLWREIDPTDASGQFVDRGSEYRPAIFYHSEREKELAIASKNALSQSGRFDGSPLTIEIVPFVKFYAAEDYHQDYYKNNPVRYKVYRHGSGRDQFLEKIWGDDLHAPYLPDLANENKTDNLNSYSRPDDNTLRESLTEMQYQVTQHDATEPPYQNEYWDNKDDGIYVDVVSGEPLFSSTTKFKSGTGWPSFYQPIDETFIVEKTDYKLLFPRTEVRSKNGNSHLGHVFNDGPDPTGLRYCINSAALKFVPKEELVSKGYESYLSLFSN